MVVVMDAAASDEQIDAVVALVNDSGGDAFVSRGNSAPSWDWSGTSNGFWTSTSRTCPASPRPCGSPPLQTCVPGPPPGPFDRVGRSGWPPGADRPRDADHDRRSLRGRDARADPRRGTTGDDPGRHDPARWRLQAQNLALRLPGTGVAGLRILADVRAETGLPVVTEIVDAGTSTSSRTTPTCCRSAPATWPTSRCCRRSVPSANRCCSSAA